MTEEQAAEREPGPFSHVWGWFIDLHSRRGFDGASGHSHPINFTEINAWCAVTGTALATHELRLILSLDNCFLTEERKLRARIDRETAQKNKSKARTR